MRAELFVFHYSIALLEALYAVREDLGLAGGDQGGASSASIEKTLRSKLLVQPTLCYVMLCYGSPCVQSLRMLNFLYTCHGVVYAYRYTSTLMYNIHMCVCMYIYNSWVYVVQSTRKSLLFSPPTSPLHCRLPLAPTSITLRTAPSATLTTDRNSTK
jgi:hypothetical protein